MKEEWKNLKNMRYKYELSNYGNIRYEIHGKWKSPYINHKKNGKHVTLRLETGVRKEYRIASLVLEYFYKSRPKGFVAFHKDKNKLNCRLDNLYWGSKKIGLTEETVIEIRNKYVRGERNVTQLSKEYGITRDTVRSIYRRILSPNYFGISEDSRTIKVQLSNFNGLRTFDCTLE